jgi:glycosyltransferase involved in cell wall biosynthesis
MRIAFISELFPPSIGGQEVRFAEFADELAERGHDVEVLTIRHAKGILETERRVSGVMVTRRPYLPNYQPPPGKRFPRSPSGMIRFAIASRRWLAANEAFDALFLNQWPWLHVLTLSRRDARHAIIDWCEVRSAQPYHFFQKLLPRRVAGNTAVSQEVMKQIGRPSAKGLTATIPSGIVCKRYMSKEANDRHGILYLGRLSPHKDVPLLISAYEVLCDLGCMEPLIIAGDGPAADGIRAYAASSPYASRITMTGLVSEERKVELLASARVFVMPSRREGFPRVVAEAMASGLPTVAVKHPGNGTVSVVEEFRCGLSADATPRSVADAIMSVLTEWQEHSIRSINSSKRLDLPVLVDYFEAFVGTLKSMKVA